MTGILGSADLLNGPNEAIYINNKSAATVATINICNKNPSNSAFVRIAISDTESPNSTDWVEYDTEIQPRGVLERSGLWVNALQYIVVRSNLSNVSAVAWGVTKGTVNISAPGLTPVTIGTISWVTSAGLPNAPLSLVYRTYLIATDTNSGTVFYNLASGSTLPTGLGISNQGVIEGIATSAGSFNFTITASNGVNSTNRTFSLTVS